MDRGLNVLNRGVELMTEIRPCPHCQQTPDPIPPHWPIDWWAIYCPCSDSGLEDDTEGGEGTIDASEEAVIERWNELVEDIICGRA